MNMVNERVEHVIFGSGVITEINSDRIWVQFQDNIGMKKFVYPDAFEKFLKAVNPMVENNIMDEWHRKKEQIEVEIKNLEKEREASELEEKKAKLAIKNKKSTGAAMKKKSKN